MAGPFTRADFQKLVPEDKKLQPEWLASLTARGQRAVYRGSELEKIGMPIGGLCAGQVYFGGDGRLWHWDIFNRRIGTGAEHYAKPLAPTSPLRQGFALRVLGAAPQRRTLDRDGWRDISFNGEYPIGTVEYRDADSPVSARLEAFSPFIPLQVEDSSLPLTAMVFTVKNTSDRAVEAELAGWLENVVCLHSAALRDGSRHNTVHRTTGLLAVTSSATEKDPASRTPRPDIVFENFEGETYGRWTTTGDAFGTGPVEIARIQSYQGDVKGVGKRVVNSHSSSPGSTVESRDAAKGTLTSPPFEIERDFIAFRIGGGAHAQRTCMNLLVDGKVVRTATGQNANNMHQASWNVRRWQGRKATLEIVDQESGPWGNIGIDEIVFTDQPEKPLGPIADEPDFGSFALALLEPRPDDFAAPGVNAEAPAESVFAHAQPEEKSAERPFNEPLIGGVGRKFRLAPGAEQTAVFLVCWHLPKVKMDKLPPGRHYGTRFADALAVVDYVRQHWARLSGQTRLWHDTWYDSSLPYWFLDRTFLNTSILATSTCFRFADGRFYGWEGVGCCEGTCGHVWQYAHAMARLFPELERITREKVDFGLALQPDGAIHFRGEFNDIPAIDAQAGTILRALREHQHSADDAFLKRNWPAIKRAVEWLIAKDGNSDGLIEGNQHNTLDTDWFGPVAWLSGLYLAALAGAIAMAEELGDTEFAKRCRGILDAGRKNITERLFEDGYYLNRPDPKHLDAINSGTGCEIDQVFGQSWAFQVGLPRIFPEAEARSALKSLWRYNFTPDVGPYRKTYTAGRWYAMPGEAGLLMCAFPRSDWDYAQAKGKGPDWAAGYFNECMNGFEYQAAGHMIWEGMLTEGLAVTRAVHDRYHPSRRNPWNEVECGDHYARSMASYGVFLAACGYEYHGPHAHLGFQPRLKPEQFKAAFTTAEGWGSFSQSIRDKKLALELRLKWGALKLKTLAVQIPAGATVKAAATVDGVAVRVQSAVESGRLTISFEPGLALKTGQTLEVIAG